MKWIAWLEFELTHFDVTDQPVSHYAMWTQQITKFKENLSHENYSAMCHKKITHYILGYLFWCEYILYINLRRYCLTTNMNIHITDIFHPPLAILWPSLKIARGGRKKMTISFFLPPLVILWPSLFFLPPLVILWPSLFFLPPLAILWPSLFFCLPSLAILWPSLFFSLSKQSYDHLFFSPSLSNLMTISFFLPPLAILWPSLFFSLP